MNIAASLRRQNVSFESIVAALFRKHKTPQNTSVKDLIYKQFTRALREYEMIDHLIYHCRIIPSIITHFGSGKAQCPCRGGMDASGNTTHKGCLLRVSILTLQ